MTGRWQGIVRGVLLLAVGLTLGLLLSLVLRPSVTDTITPVDAGSARVWLSVERLEAEQRALKASLAELRQELAERQQVTAANTDRLQALKAELDRQQFLAGLTPVRGPGVVVTLNDSQAQVPSGSDPNAFIIHEYDLRDIVNLLWMAGSEAIAINEERMVSDSSIYCLGSTVMVNNTRLSPPYSIRAIGNPRIQQDYLRNPSYLRHLKEKVRLYGLRFDVEAATSVSLPAHTGGFLVQHAKPGP